MNPQEAFVTRLRRHRQRNRISIDEIAAATRVRREVFEALEKNDLSEWPRGVYARAWIRAYAEAVGLDANDTVNDFCRLFPHGDRRAGATIQEIAAIIAAPSEYRDEFSHPQDRRRSGDVAAPAPSWHAPVVQAARALWARIAAAATPSARTRRSPHTTT